jgi:hypothetical protein
LFCSVLSDERITIRSVITYTCPAWEFASECRILKLQRLQNKVLRTIGNFPKRTSVPDMHNAFHIPYIYDYITKSCRQQAEVIKNHENEIVHYIGQGEARHRKYKRLKLVRLPALQDFLRNRGSGTRSTQPHEYN